MENKEIKKAEAIRASYEEKKTTKLNELVELDKKAKNPAKAFACAFGTAGALVLGTGMCLAMKVVGKSLSFGMPLGIAIGCAGIAIVSVNYFLYKKILQSRKKKYAAEILKLSDEIINE